MEYKDLNAAWKKNCIKIGTPTVLLAVLTSFVPVIWLCVHYDCWPDTNLILQAWGLLAATSIPFYIVEPVSYFNALGMSGTYMSFLAGNIGNMRVPCACQALDATNTERGTLESEVVATLGIAGSVVTNAIFVLIAALVGTAIVAALPESVSQALSSFASPAIFGALFGSFAIKKPSLAVVGLVIPFLLTFIGVPNALILLGTVFGTMGISRIFYVHERNKSAQ